MVLTPVVVCGGADVTCAFVRTLLIVRERSSLKLLLVRYKKR